MVNALYITPYYGVDIGIDILDERFDNRGTLKPAFRSETPRRADGSVDFAAMTPTYPRAIKWKDKAGRRMPDFTSARGANLSVAARTIIERFEPGIHEFIPVECTHSRGGTVEPRYWFRSAQTVDALDPEASNMVMMLGSYRGTNYIKRLQQTDPDKLEAYGLVSLPPWLDLNAPSKFVFKSDRVADVHLFAVEGLDRSSTFLSSELYQAFIDEGLIGFHHYDAPIPLS